MTRARRWLVIGLLVLAAACGGDEATADPADAAVGIRASGCGLVDRLGTGAVVRDGDRTLLVTSAHTVAGSSTIAAERGTRRAPVELLGIDTERDIAVLSAPDWTQPGRRLAAPTLSAPAQIAMWSPDEPITVAPTEVTRLLRVTIEDIYVQGEHERRAFELDAGVVRGDSGAPVIADDGSVLGIVYARSRERGGVAFAVSALELEAVIDTTGTEPIESGRCA